jgi:uncharacterized protein YkwD
VAVTGRHTYRPPAAGRVLLTVVAACLTVIAAVAVFRSVVTNRPSATHDSGPAQAGAPLATSESPTGTTSATGPEPTTTTATVPSKPATPPNTQPGLSTDVAQALLNQINAWRAAEGVGPLTMTSGLVASAHKHNLRMSAGCGMTHQCPDEASLGSRISAEGISWRAIAENVAWHSSVSSNGVLAVAKALNEAMHGETPPDDGHRRNMLNDAYHRIGVDIVRDANGQVWLTEDFAN